MILLDTNVVSEAVKPEPHPSVRAWLDAQAGRTIAAVTGPAAPRTADSTVLRRLVVGAGLGWALLFVAVGVAADLQSWGDGSIFAYAVAVRDAWAFHWHNISGRLFTTAVAHLPAEALVALTGEARAGIVAYGVVFFAAPLAGLLATRLADRSPRRRFFLAACLSTALLCPLVFGCPTEMWMAHAVFWPTLALCHGAPPGRGGAAAVGLALLALVFTHEGALVLAAAILATLALRGRRDPRCRRAAAALAAVLVAWTIVKLTVRPDDYIAGVLADAAFRFVDPRNLADPAVLLLAAALVVFGLAAAALRHAGAAAPVALAAAATAALLTGYWLGLDRALLAENRYPLRLVLLIGPPVLAVIATVQAMADDGPLPDRLRRLAAPGAAPTAALRRAILRRAARPEVLAGALAIVTLVHAVETAKFVLAWRDYAAAVRRLATGEVADPELGEDGFVSAARIAPPLARLAWNSTTPYLSVLVAPGFAPRRLVVDPTATYFWISCGTATRSARDSVGIPAAARELVRRLACLHRPI